jgi:hypothetical protein
VAKEEWRVIRSESGVDAVGCPYGQILCRSQEDAELYIKEHKIKDAVVSDYLDEKPRGETRGKN